MTALAKETQESEDEEDDDAPDEPPPPPVNMSRLSTDQRETFPVIPREVELRGRLQILKISMQGLLGSMLKPYIFIESLPFIT